MKYEPLKKLYYTDPQKWKEEYDLRFNSNSAKHLNIEIREVNRRTSYPAFFCYNEEITLLLNQILKESITMYKCIDLVPKVAITQFINSSLINEVKFTNDIEGVSSTRKEIKDALNQEDPKKYVRLWGIVDKYKKIIEQKNIKLDTPEDIRNLYDNFVLKEVVRANKSNAPDGIIFRKTPVEVITKTDKVLHTGLYPENKIIEAMNAALEILYNQDIPKLIRIAIFHYLFGYIHPFYDGNGRMSRFITSYFLAKEIHPILGLHLSYLIKKYRNEYYSLFEDTNNEFNKGDLTPFIISSLELILRTTRNISSNLLKKHKRFNYYYKYLDRLSQKEKNIKYIYHILLQASVFSDFGASIEEIALPLGKSTKTIATKIKQIPAEEITINKKTRPFHYKLNLSHMNYLINKS